MNQPIELSIEQQFSLRSFETQVSKMSQSQAQEFLIKLYGLLLMREATYKHLLGEHWKVETIDPGTFEKS